MRAKKLLAMLMAGTMAISLMACGQGATTSESQNATSENEVATVVSTSFEGTSIDFEDGNCGFITEVSALKGGDPSTLTVEDLNGSKALKTTNVFGKSDFYLGLDLEALLGDKIADVANIQFTVGVAGDEFYAVSGKVYSYAGEEAKEIILGDYSVYIDTNNPKTVNMSVKEPFVAGANNYIIISKEDDTGSVPTEMFFDDFGFFDADGNVIEADSTAVIAASSPLVAVEEAKTMTYGTVVEMENKYGGDWGQTAVVPAEIFEGADGNVNVTVNFSLEAGYEYYLIAPMDAAWTRLTADDYVDLVPASEGVAYHLQDDGFIVIDDWAIDSLSFTVNKAAADKIVSGGGLSFQVYGVTASNVVVSDDTFAVGMENTYGGDWGQTAVIPGGIFEGADGNVNVTVDFALEAGYEYYLMAPMNAAWTRLTADDYVDLVPASEGVAYHLQDDGFIVIDDWAIDSVSFTITKEAAENLAGAGGLSFQVYGVTASKALVSNSIYTVGMENTYGGDWGQTAVIPGGIFEDVNGNVNVTVDFALEAGYEYYLMAPMNAAWTRLTADDYVDLVPASEGVAYHLQDDGFIVIDDWAIDSVSFTITKEAAENLAGAGGLSFQVYGVTASKAVVSDNTFVYTMENKYGGDWGQAAVVPAGIFAGAEGNVTVVANFKLEPGYEYYLMAPMNSAWTRLSEDAYVDLVVADEGVTYHLQNDGFLPIDDWAITSLSFTITKEAAENIAGTDGLSFQIYGTTLESVVVVK